MQRVRPNKMVSLFSVVFGVETEKEIMLRDHNIKCMLCSVITFTNKQKSCKINGMNITPPEYAQNFYCLLNFLLSYHLVCYS